MWTTRFPIVEVDEPAWIDFAQISNTTTVDLIVGRRRGGIEWHQAPGTFLYSPRWRRFTAADAQLAPAPSAGLAADVDGDGAAEIVYADAKLRQVALLKSPTGRRRQRWDALLLRHDTKE